DRDGRIVAIRSIIHADIGAYVRTAGLVPAEFGAALLPGPYRVPNYSCDLWSVVTNKTPVGTLRSPGRPECNFVRERLLDAAAVRRAAAAGTTVDSGAASAARGLAAGRAPMGGDPPGLPAGRGAVRPAGAAAAESGAGTYGPRGTVTAGNAAHMAAAKLLSE